MKLINKPLYIGLNGLAGSGKDTVAKMLKVILSKKWESIDECKEYYNNYFNDPNESATFNKKANINSDSVVCLAFADQLKQICSTIFGIPVERFYNNKSNAWICINKDFEYTEIRPDNIISSDEYYYNCEEYKKSDKKYYLSLRDILVYIGTYVLQLDINKDVFINIVQNKINNIILSNENLKYVIITDIRFFHELDYTYNHNGITIKIYNPNIIPLNNIAEHDLDNEDNFTYFIENDGTYDALFQKVWDLVQSELVFTNTVEQLYTRADVDNYLRQISNNEWKLCSPYKVSRIVHRNGNIAMVDLVGGPKICVDEIIPGTKLIAKEINIDTYGDNFIITTDIQSSNTDFYYIKNNNDEINL